MKKLIAIMVLAVGVTLAAPAAANAATCGTYGLTQTANTAAPGAVVSVTSCFGEAPGTPVSVAFDGPDASSGDLFSVTPAASQSSTLGATGAVTYQVRIPASATNGTVYTVSASTAQSTFSGTITAVVVPASSGLAVTGLGLPPLLWVAVTALLAVGVVLAIVAVRRARRA